jgi:hypothetical protein
VPFFRVEAAFLSPCHSEKADQTSEFWESTKHVPLPRDQFTMAGFDVCQSAKAVDLQYKNKLIGIERLDTAGEPYGT